MLMTTSRVAMQFSRVCLSVLSLTLLAGEKIKIGGLEPKQLKKLKGARFGLPSASIVHANAIGRGATEPSKYPCNFPVEMVPGIISVYSSILDSISGMYWTRTSGPRLVEAML